jgi:hypothetical protein
MFFHKIVIKFDVQIFHQLLGEHQEVVGLASFTSLLGDLIFATFVFAIFFLFEKKLISMNPIPT